MLSPNPHNDWCLAPSAWLVLTSPDGCKVENQPSKLGGQGAKSITDDWSNSRLVQQWTSEEPGEFRGSLTQTILSQASLEREGKVHRLGSSPVGPSGPKRRAPHRGDEIVSSVWRHTAARDVRAVPNSRLGMNTRQYDHERGSSSLEEFECLSTKCGLMLVHTKPGELREQPDRPILIQASLLWSEEGATTIPKGSRAKRSEAPGACIASHDIVSPAWEHAAA